MPGGGDRMAELRGMIEAFRRQGEGGGGDQRQDPLARVGWVQDEPIWIGLVIYRDPQGNTHVDSWVRHGDHWKIYHTTAHTDGTSTMKTTTVPDDGEQQHHVEHYDSETGEIIAEGEMQTSDDPVVQVKPVLIEGDPGGGDDQPNPADDSDGLGFLDGDPWALFLAWYTGQTGSPLKNPYDDDPGEPAETPEYSHASAAERLASVINPVDPLWGSSSGGGGNGQPNPPGCIDPDSVGPPWLG